MRYALGSPSSKLTLAPGVCSTTSLRPLVPPPRPSHALPADHRPARPPAIALPPIAPTADTQGLAAASTVKSAMALWLPA